MTAGAGSLLRTAARRGVRAAAAVLVAGAVVVALVLLAPALAGYHRYVITGGSMGGTYDRGSVVFAREVPVGDLRVGDVIAYRPPPGSGPEGLVTHRIVARRTAADGRLVFRTKGDANGARDPWTFTLDGPAQARVSLGVPLVGYVPAALAIRELRMLAVGLPALVIALFSLRDLWRVSTAPRPPGRREATA